MYLTADGRGRTPTFRPADMDGQNLHALRAGEMSPMPCEAHGELRLIPHREARASFSSGSPGAKNQSLRQSACVCGKKSVRHLYFILAPCTVSREPFFNFRHFRHFRHSHPMPPQPLSADMQFKCILDGRLANGQVSTSDVGVFLISDS